MMLCIWNSSFASHESIYGFSTFSVNQESFFLLFISIEIIISCITFNSCFVIVNMNYK